MELVSPADLPLTAARQRYLTNLTALYVADPELAARIEALPFSATPRIEPTRDGQWTFQTTADDGKPLYVHSRYRPTEEAQTLVRTQTARKPPAAGQSPGSASSGPPESATQPPAPPFRQMPSPQQVESPESLAGEDLESPCVLVSGLGLGYAVAALEEHFRRPLLIVAECDLAVIKAALGVTDMSEPLRERRMTFLVSADKAALHQRLRSAITPLMLGLKYVSLPHVNRCRASFHREISALMRDFVYYSRVQMFSLLRHSRVTCQNIAFNLPAYLRQPGVEVLKGRGAGFPAIVVAAGPSLARNLDRLGELRDHAVIISVQTLLKTLLARGTPPHFVTSLDYHEISAQFYHGIEDFGGTILVAEPKATWHVLDAYRGRAHVLHSDFVDDLLREAAPQRGSLRAGSTVAHLAFYLAEHLGCNPIILVGQDLSFSDGLYYPPGMQVERIWRPELSRFLTVETKQWERVARHRANLRKVIDVQGRQIYTDDQLFTYAEQFQSDFLSSRSRIIQAAEGGMRFQGTEVMPLAEAAREFCTRRLPPDLFRLDAVPAPEKQKARAIEALEQRLVELGEIRQVATEMQPLLDRLLETVEQPDTFNRLMVRVDELRSRLLRHDRTYNVVVQVAQHAELRRVQADRAIRDDEEETPQTARRRLRRDREYVAAFLEGCDYLLQMLPQALQRVREQP